MKLKGPYLTLLTGFVLAVVLLVMSMYAAAKDTPVPGYPAPQASATSAAP